MKVMPQKSVSFRAEDGACLRIRFDNRGEPYREGVTLDFDHPEEFGPTLFLDPDEALRLRDVITALYPSRFPASGLAAGIKALQRSLDPEKLDDRSHCAQVVMEMFRSIFGPEGIIAPDAPEAGPPSGQAGPADDDPSP